MKSNEESPLSLLSFYLASPTFGSSSKSLNHSSLDAPLYPSPKGLPTSDAIHISTLGCPQGVQIQNKRGTRPNISPSTMRNEGGVSLTVTKSTSRTCFLIFHLFIHGINTLPLEVHIPRYIGYNNKRLINVTD